MKKNIFLFLGFLLIIPCLIYSQDQGMMERRQRPSMQKIEQLEKAKLIEVLDLDEETAVRFFVRRKDYREKQHEFFKRRDELVKINEKKLLDGKTIPDKECKELTNEMLSIELEIFQEKEKFFNSLHDILTPQQILKLAVFDNRFMREIREVLMGRKRNK